MLPPIIRTMKEKRRQKNLMTGLIILVILLIGTLFYGYFQYKTVNEEKSSLNASLSANTQTVYVAKRLIERGETIISEGTDANVELQTVYTGLEAYNYITEDEIGDVATIDIAEGVPIMCVMVADKTLTNDSREFEVAAVNIATDQREYDVIDVRILFPDGSDYIVLSKLEINELSLENCIFTSILNEEEILRYSCAIIDAYTTPGTKLYTTRYVESSLQDAAEPNYPVSDVTRALIQSDPNVVTKATNTLNATARQDLEIRLGLIEPEDMDAVNNAISQENEKKNGKVDSEAN